MEEKEDLIRKLSKYILEIIIGVAGIISFVLTITCFDIADSAMRVFICSAIAIFTILSISSVVTYKKEIAAPSKGKYFLIMDITWNYTIWIILMVLYYKIRFCPTVPGDNSYWIYNILTVYIIISATMKYLFRFLKERREAAAEGKISIFAQFIIAIWFAWVPFYLCTFGCYWLFIPPHTVDLNNAVKPFSMEVYKYSYIKSDLLSNNFHISLRTTIKDEKLLDRFINEISTKTAEKIRGVEYIHIEVKENLETHFILYPKYKDSSGNDITRPYVFDGMYFYELRMYKNGQLILVKNRKGVNILMPTYREGLYKLDISPELEEKLLGF